MKSQFCLISFLLFGGIVKSQDCFGEYFTDSGFCSNTINLWSDSTFFWEYGCEGRSNIVSGRYQIIGNRIKFHAIEKDSFNLIYKIEWVDSLDSHVKPMPSMLFPAFILVDRNDDIIKGQEIVCYNPLGNYRSMLDKQKGWHFFPHEETSELYLPEISKMFKRFISIEIPKKPIDKPVLKITLNIESTFLRYNEVQYQSNILEGEGLIENGQIIMEDETFTLIFEKK